MLDSSKRWGRAVFVFVILGSLVTPVIGPYADLYTNFDLGTVWADDQRADSAPSGPSLGTTLRWFFGIFLVLCLVGLALLAVSAIFLFWYAKRLIENAVKPNLPRLERIVARLRAKHPDLDDDALSKKLIFRQSNQAGLVGFVTGLGGLPFLPIAVPIDIAASIKIQSNLVHLLRILRGTDQPAKDVSDASLWLITTGGQELTSASSTVIRELLIKYLSKSLLKFLPVVGGLVGFLLNWISTQALGRLSLKWLDREITQPDVPPPDAVLPPPGAHEATDH